MQDYRQIPPNIDHFSSLSITFSSYNDFLFINVAAGIAGVISGGLGIMAATIISLALWCLTFPVATAMLAILFQRASGITA